MIEFGITVVVIVLVIAIIIFLKKRKECSSCCPSKETPKSESKIPNQATQQPETKAADKPVVKSEPTQAKPQITETAVASAPESKPATKPADIKPPVQPQVKEAAVSPVESTSSSLLPQDSVLKRHYLTHVFTMIETIAPPRPTDSVLCRHYDAMLVAELDQCLSDKKAMEQLIHDYENKK